jgi:hypothetical protein
VGVNTQAAALVEGATGMVVVCVNATASTTLCVWVGRAAVRGCVAVATTVGGIGETVAPPPWMVLSFSVAQLPAKTTSSAETHPMGTWIALKSTRYHITPSLALLCSRTMYRCAAVMKRSTVRFRPGPRCTRACAEVVLSTQASVLIAV